MIKVYSSRATRFLHDYIVIEERLEFIVVPAGTSKSMLRRHGIQAGTRVMQ
jgi:hypothetical protein